MEHARAELSPDVFAEVQRRIEERDASYQDAGEHMSTEKTGPQDLGPGQRREPSNPRSTVRSYVQTSVSNGLTHGFPGMHSHAPAFASGTKGKTAATVTNSTTATTATTAIADTTDTTGPVTVDAPGLPDIPELERMKGAGDMLNGRFLLEECIGLGGMGMVYRALDLRKREANDRHPYIAVKVLNVQFRGHPKSLIALQREARKAQALAHPNIVAVYDFDRDGSMVYLTMELLVGQPLSQMLGHPDFNGMQLAEALPIIAGISNALAYSHQRGFVHCDLKPANVFLTDRGEVKVIDFGIARVFQKPDEEIEVTVFDAGSLGGLTPAYASPEMIEHRVPDPRDDIYALACITYQLMTGRHPFERMSATQARSIGMKPVRPRHLSHRQWRALRSGLSFERETRAPSVIRFLDAITDRRRHAVRVALGSTATFLVILAGIAISRYDDPSETGAESTGDPVATAPPAGVARPGVAPLPQQPGAGNIAAMPPLLPEPPPGPPAGSAPAPVLGQGVSAARLPAPMAPTVLPGAVDSGGPAPALQLTSLTPVLARVPCSALAATVQGNTVEVKGFLSREYGVVRLKEELRQVPGVQAVNVIVQQTVDRDCGIMNLLAPYWVKSRETGALIRSRSAGGLLTEGEPLIMDVTTPAHDTWVHVDYFLLDGGVIHLLPSLRARDNQAPPSYSATVGSLGNWIVSKPFGTELIVLLTTPVPLFNGLRPEYEKTADYLRALKKQLRSIEARQGEKRITVDFVQINTEPKKP